MNIDLNTLFSYYNKINTSQEFITELELRAPCVCSILDNNELIVGMNTYKILSKETYTIYYYSSPLNMKTSYRAKSKNSALLEHKELIALSSLSHPLISTSTTIALSTESKIMRKQITFPLIITDQSSITRYKLHTNPILEIIYRNDINPTIEIEFNPTQFEIIKEMYLNLQSLPMWPPPQYLKPKQVSILELARKISSGTFVISAKADGIHALLYTSVIAQDFIFIVSDIGTILYSSITNIKDAMNTINSKSKAGELLVLEVEYISNNKICVFDIAKGGTYNYWTIESDTYLERITYLSSLISNDLPQLVFKKIKPITSNNDINISTFKSISDNFSQNDGFIISNNTVLKERFKLKYKPTVDLIYKNNIFTNNNNISISASNPYNIKLITSRIYEIEIESKSIIRIRNDKNTPNIEMPNECPSNVHEKLANSIGIPFTRVNNNKIKYKLLLYLKNNSHSNTIIDIGSGNMGDIHKWIKLNYKTVYSIDPNLNTDRLNKTKHLGNTKIYPYPYTALECYNININNNNIINNNNNSITNIQLPKSYVLSIFFVPWSDSFLPYIINSHLTAIILMDNPKNISSSAYTLQLKNNIIKLNIPETSTATNIEENLISIDEIISKLNNLNIDINKLNNTSITYKYTKLPPTNLNIAPPIENKLIKMYTPYIIYSS